MSGEDEKEIYGGAGGTEGGETSSAYPASRVEGCGETGDAVIAVYGGRDITFGGPPAQADPVKGRIAAAVGMILAYEGDDAPPIRKFKRHVRTHGLKITAGDFPGRGSFRIVSLTEFVIRPELVMSLETGEKLAGKLMSAVAGMAIIYEVISPGRQFPKARDGDEQEAASS
jgi:hypothetical protein